MSFSMPHYKGEHVVRIAVEIIIRRLKSAAHPAVLSPFPTMFGEGYFYKRFFPPFVVITQVKIASFDCATVVPVSTYHTW
jgi:hypothetical protein